VDVAKSRWVKCLAAVGVMLLYGLPLYQTYFSPREAGWANLEIREDLPTPATSDDKPYFASQFVNQAQPGVACHVSSIAVAGENRLICTWYAGSQEGARDVAIFSALYDEHRVTWTDPQKVLDPQQSSAELRRWVRKVGNAVVVNDRRGGLWLFYASMLGGWSTTSLNYKVSRDEGKTWSASRKLLVSPFFNLTNNVKNKGVNLSRGAYLLPVYHEFLNKFSQVVLFRMNEANPHFEIRRMTYSREAIQPALVSQDGRTLAAFFRNSAGQGNRFILQAKSGDVGRNWSEVRATSLPHPNSGFDMIRLSDGAILGVVNYAFQERSDLSLVISRDEGKTWEKVEILENTPGREYSYPSLARTRQYYHLTYTYERKRIKHVVFNEAWLKGVRPHDH
jgi:predicted neuraminidase